VAPGTAAAGRLRPAREARPAQHSRRHAARAKKQEVGARLAEQTVEKQWKHFKAAKDLQVEFDRNAKIRKAQAK
jgi:hypothetical protein